MNCQICAAELPTDALFCGECGSSTSATPQSRQRPDARPTDTTQIQPIRPRQTTGVVSVALDGSAVTPAAPAAVDAAAVGAAQSEPRGAGGGAGSVVLAPARTTRSPTSQPVLRATRAATDAGARRLRRRARR